jgi:hypothetical protein
VRTTPGTVSIQIMRASDAALSAFAMTNETYQPTVPAELQTRQKRRHPRLSCCL